MARFVDISVLGDKALERKLRKLDERVQKKIVRKALRSGAKPVLADAKAYVPIDTGALESELKITASRARRGFFGVQVATPPRSILGIGPDDKGYYPAILEYGSDKMEPIPYLRPAFDNNRGRALAIIRDVLVKGVREAVR